ncbi:DUF4263 domain-containing protein [bacterium]|nr:DUF4263 domain-containing protein [bacterium]
MGDRIRKQVVKSTSRQSAICPDIELSITKTTKLVFRPEIANNPHNQQACVKGQFIHFRKSKAGQWIKKKTYKRSRIPKDHAVNLPLDTAATLKLIEGLLGLRRIYDKNGIPYGEKEYVLTSKNAGAFAEQLADLADAETIIESLSNLSASALDNLGTAVGISRLHSALQVWNDHKEDADEEFWHETFRSHSWLIAQLFLHPVIIFQDKAYVGGKGRDNTGGNIADFLLQNKLTTNILLLEIKTPTTRLLGKKYREGVYPVSQALCGAVNQVLIYKQELLNNFYTSARDRKRESEGFDPKCVIIAGSLDEIEEREKIGSLEVFRSQLKNVEIVTYDELFEKTKDLLDLLTIQIEEEN